MYVMHVALAGCLGPPPIRHGLTQDTGGALAYVLGAAEAQALRSDTEAVDIVTRRFDDPALGADHDLPMQQLGPRLRIIRIASASRGYLAQPDLGPELPDLALAFLGLLSMLPRRPDLIHCHGAEAMVLGRAARARHRMPLLYTPHAHSLRARLDAPPPQALRDQLARERTALREADAIIASTRDEAERQIAAYDPLAAGRVWRINPGVALPRPRGDARALLATLDRPEAPFLLAIARPVRQKNLMGLLDAYIASPALQARANLVILAGQPGGEAEQRAIRRELTLRAASAGLGGKVLMPHSHDPGIVPLLYARCAIQRGVLVNPALHESLGLTLIEAARFGLPVVATRNGGPQAILDRIGHGLAVDPARPRAIAAACLRLVRDAGLWRRLSQNARNGQGQFSWDRWAERVATIAARLLSPRAPFRPGPLPRTILAFDLDATLSGCPVGALRFSDWAQGAGGRGQRIVLTTDAPVSEARGQLADWSLPEPQVLITSLGSEIWRPHHRGALRLCIDYAAWVTEGWHRAAVREAIEALGLDWRAAHEQRAWRLALAGTPADAARVTAALGAQGLQARVIASGAGTIDVLPRRAGKPEALAFEARRLGLSLADCVAAGDGARDTALLAAAGRAILVGASAPALPDRPGLYRARAAHGVGVVEGLAHFDLGAAAQPRGIPAE